MADEVQGRAAKKRRPPRRVPSTLERMVKKLNDMRVASMDERVVIANTICNVETADAMAKVVSMDGQSQLANWLTQAIDEGHVGLQCALLRLSMRLPLDMTTTTPLHAVVNDLLQDNPSVDPDVRDLAKSVWAQWSTERPAPSHFTITVGTEERRQVMFERDPEFHSESEDGSNVGEEQPPNKRQRPAKSLRWAPEHKLEAVRVFHRPVDEQHGGGAKKRAPLAAPPVAVRPQLESWTTPPKVHVPPECVRVDPVGSGERAMQAARISSLMDVVYFKRDQIPPNPSLPDGVNTGADVVNVFTKDLLMLEAPSGGMISAVSSDAPLAPLQSVPERPTDSNNAAMLEELLAADPSILSSLLHEAAMVGVGGDDRPPPEYFSGIRPRSPPPMRHMSPPRRGSVLNPFGLPLPPSPPRHLPPADHMPGPPYGRRSPSPPPHQRPPSPPRRRSLWDRRPEPPARGDWPQRRPPLGPGGDRNPELDPRRDYPMGGPAERRMPPPEHWGGPYPPPREHLGDYLRQGYPAPGPMRPDVPPQFRMPPDDRRDFRRGGPPPGPYPPRDFHPDDMRPLPSGPRDAYPGPRDYPPLPREFPADERAMYRGYPPPDMPYGGRPPPRGAPGDYPPHMRPGMRDFPPPGPRDMPPPDRAGPRDFPPHERGIPRDRSPPGRMHPHDRRGFPPHDRPLLPLHDRGGPRIRDERFGAPPPGPPGGRRDRGGSRDRGGPRDAKPNGRDDSVRGGSRERAGKWEGPRGRDPDQGRNHPEPNRRPARKGSRDQSHDPANRPQSPPAPSDPNLDQFGRLKKNEEPAAES
ncbi:TFIIS N-terminal domain-containing protein [Plasmodiophora brassicae]|uniref:TFIIS N-terminal domain-containing protein n=1 Tax=Plasmodiophora brassicae TaxID=37360 RepID=A0A0G4J6N3_PLABS|nr:hypothetical protein PBRA_002975 [Plasmodiophora brassicae]